MRTTAYLKAIMEIFGKTITGLGPCTGIMDMMLDAGSDGRGFIIPVYLCK